MNVKVLLNTLLIISLVTTFLFVIRMNLNQSDCQKLIEPSVNCTSCNVTVPAKCVINSALNITRERNKYITTKKYETGNLTHTMLMNMTSSYKFSDDHFGYTVVISGWRRPSYIIRIIEAFMNQTHKPSEIWISVFASPNQLEYEEIIKKFISSLGKNHGIKAIFGDPQLSYWGRFQLALQSRTPYTILVDDDCIPGSNFVSSVMHIMHTKYHGLYGIKGNRYGVSKFYISGHNSNVDYLEQVDVVGGIWVAKTTWLKYMFYETPYSWLTAEDSQLSYSLRKYLNLPSYIYPSNMEDDATKPINKDYSHISFHGDTTDYIADGRREVRVEVVNHLWKNGLIWTSKPLSITGVNITLIILDSIESAIILSDFKPSETINHVFGVIIAGTTHGMDNEIKANFKGNGYPMLTFDLNLLVDNHPSYTREIDIIAQVLYSMQQILEATQPQHIVSLMSDSEVIFGAIQVASSLSIDYVGLLTEQDISPTPKMNYIRNVASKICLDVNCLNEEIT
jgi:hypothetical protein